MRPTTRFLWVVLITAVAFVTACTAGPTSQVVSLERFIGHRVETRDGNMAGVLEQVFLNPQQGQIQYGVVQLVPGPFHSSKVITLENPPKVAVPWEMLTIGQDGSFLVVDASIDQLWQAPVFTSEQSADRPGWDQPVLQYWAATQAVPD